MAATDNHRFERRIASIMSGQDSQSYGSEDFISALLCDEHMAKIEEQYDAYCQKNSREAMSQELTTAGKVLLTWLECMPDAEDPHGTVINSFPSGSTFKEILVQIKALLGKVTNRQAWMYSYYENIGILFDDDDTCELLRIELGKTEEEWEHIRKSIDGEYGQENMMDTLEFLADDPFLLFKYIQIAKERDKNSLSKEDRKALFEDIMWTYQASLSIIPYFQDSYEKWKQSVKERNLNVQWTLAHDTYFISDIEDEAVLRRRLICQKVFLYHYIMSGADGGDYVFGYAMAKRLQNPMQILAFQDNLKEHKYSSLFCNEMNNYDSEHNLQPLFHISEVVDYAPDDRGRCQNPPQWVEIPESFIVGSSIPDESINAIRYNCVTSLFRLLVEKGDILGTQFDQTFIYRFTGMGGPIDYSLKIPYCGNASVLACIINLLFPSKPYTLFSSFFMNEKGKDLNLSVLASKALHAKKQESMKEARRLLIDAGFKIPVVQSYEPTQSPSQSRDSATNEVPCSTPQDTISEDDVWGKLEEKYKSL